MGVGIRRWLPVLVVVAALGLAGLAAAGGTGLTGGRLPPPEEELAEQPDQPEPTATPATAPADGARRLLDSEPPGWLDALITAFFVGLIVVVVGVFLYVGVRYLLTERVNRREIEDRAGSQPADGDLDTAEVVRDALRAGLADLDAGGDARRAVIACWLRLERVAAAAGTARLASDTPADLVARLLAAHRVSDRALGRLAEAYRQARYAPADVADELATTAQRALSDVAAQLDLVGSPR